MAIQKPSDVGSLRSALFWFLVLTVCYQVIYQSIMWQTLRAQAALEDCASDDVSAGASMHCLEAQLFRTWREASHIDGDTMSSGGHLVQGTPQEAHFGKLLAEVEHNQDSDVTIQLAPVRHATKGAMVAIAEATAAAQAALSAQEESAGRAGAGNSTPAVAWAGGLAALERHLDAQLLHLPSMQRRQATEHDARLHGLLTEVADSINRTSNVTPWAQDLMDLQERLDRRLQRRRAAHAASHHAASATTTSPAPLLDRIYELGHEMCDDEVHRSRPECARFLRGAAVAAAAGAKGPRAASTTTEAPLQNRIYELGREMCSDAAHRRLPACAQFLAGAAHAAEASELAPVQHANGTEERHASGVAGMGSATRRAVARAAELDARIADVEARGRAWEAKLVEQLSRDGAAGKQAAVAGRHGAYASLRGGDRRQFHWASVRAWPAGSRWWSGAAAVAVTRRELLAGRWAGMIPKVACVTAVSSGHGTAAQMKYFINNFRLQSYEGPTQLVLVYRHSDKKAAQIISKYVDGVAVVAVASRAEGDAFPSSTDLRYGAWEADADVIARWDFDEWYHPQRLSLQVRALAFSLRPACMLKRQEATTTAEPSGLAGEASLVGEASWMRQHWRPLTATDDSESLLTHQAHHLVELELDLMHSAAMAAPAGDVVGHGSMPAACQWVDARDAGKIDTKGLEQAIDAKVGADMMERYRGLAKRRQDVSSKLKALCGEAAAEVSDPRQQTRLRADAERMGAVLAQLDEHFKLVWGLFEGAGAPK